MNKSLVAVHNGKKVTVREDKTVVFEVESEDTSGIVDQHLENGGYVRVTPWKKAGRYSKAKVVEK